MPIKQWLSETPPLTRGRRRRGRLPADRFRNTPAYAGKTGGLFPFLRGPRKHPRLRGEDASWDTDKDERTETPPLTRGRRKVAHPENFRHGNTPAYAGKTWNPHAMRAGKGKHPRLRGEDYSAERQGKREAETPPLTRGRQFGTYVRLIWDGNTPAYAGKTQFASAWRRAPWKHPRLRGEDSNIL